MADIYHLNFHTVRHVPIFLDPEYATAIDAIFVEVIARHRIVALARAVMPTHAHFVIAAFPDQPRQRIVMLLKGASAYAFFQRYPLLGAELGGHLWQESYQWVHVQRHEQYWNAIRYVGDNRSKIGLGPIGGDGD